VSKFKAIHLICDEAQREILLAELALLPFDSFQENENGVSAYCDEEQWPEEDVQEIISRYQIEQFTIETIDKINWNEEWEKNYEPIFIKKQLAVRATFHPQTDAEMEIIITPKMSFGTGHHATTHLMMEYQLQQNYQGKNVLDVGSGTGVLAILAAKLGAKQITAIDIDDWCIENSEENFALNQLSIPIQLKKGTIQELDEDIYDIILANITLQVHLDSMNEYAERLKSGGELIMSGFYESDVKELTRAAQQAGFEFVESKTRNDWARMICKKP